MKKYYRTRKYIATTIAVSSMLASTAFAQAGDAGNAVNTNHPTQGICLAQALHAKNLELKTIKETYQSSIASAKDALKSATKDQRAEALKTYKQAVKDAKKAYRESKKATLVEFHTTKKACA